MSDLWPRKEIQPGIIDDLIDHLETRINDDFSTEVDLFLSKHPVDKWVIASDYSMGCPEYSHDAMAFVLVPYMKGMLSIDIDKALPYDLKKCKKTVDQKHIDYLKSAPALSFYSTEKHVFFRCRTGRTGIEEDADYDASLA